MTGTPRGVSVVVPVYNEEENIPFCLEEVHQVLTEWSRISKEPYEIIFIDDGSSDDTVNNLKRYATGMTSVKLVQFRRNFGQTAAMAAGFKNTKYDIVVALDGDLQNDPREIPKMVQIIRDGKADLVAGWRKDRKDKFFSRRLPSVLANHLISLTTRVKLHDYGCTLKAMSGEIARNIKLYGEMHRFIPALADELGAKIVEVPVNHRERRFGSSKYGISRTIRVILDLITVKFLLGFSKRPIHLFGSIGLSLSAAGFFTLSVVTFERFFMSRPMGSRPMFLLSVMLCLVGMQFLVFGLLAEMLARTYYESQKKDTFVIRDIWSSNQSLLNKEIESGKREGEKVDEREAA
jgi:glycosyltransferase involved in cell wall biosynthesis